MFSHNSLVFCNNWSCVLSPGLGSGHFPTFEQCDFAYLVLLILSEPQFPYFSDGADNKPTSPVFLRIKLDKIYKKHFSNRKEQYKC